MTIHQHDRAFFSSFNNEICYWAGFLAADGYIYKNNGNIRLGLAYRDRDHIKKFKKAIDSTSPIRKVAHFVKDKKYWGAQIDIYGAYECQKDLEQNYMIVQCKSKILKPPKLYKEDYIKSYIRGYMDGDGSIHYMGTGHNNHWNVSFLGTKELLEWIKHHLQKYIPNIGNPSVGPDRNIFQLIFGGYQSKLILDWLYSNSTKLTRLDRKYEKYKSVCDFYKNGPRKYLSKYNGVTLNKRVNKWTVELKHNNQRYYLGYFLDEVEAAKAYDAKAKELGLLDRLNFK